MTYNPFDKSPTDKLTTDDLQKLIDNHVAEGYYVEYKSQFVKNEKIGWSISSFANSYGGWYIVGVETDEHNIATNICGFNLSDYPDPISKIRETVKSNIDPQPLFYPQVIKLKEENAVLIVYIPDVQDKPFICKNGRVYRRIADSSDPILEANRYALDKLYEEGKETRKKYRKFCRDERIHKTNNAWVQIFLSPYPNGILNNYQEIQTWEQGSLNEIIELSKQQIKNPFFQELGMTGNIPFNSAQTSINSLIFRQNSGNLDYNSLELELFQNFQAKLFIPLEYVFPWEQDIIYSLSEPTKEIILNLIHSGNITKTKNQNPSLLFFDIGRLYCGTINMINFYQHLLIDKPFVNQIEVTIKIKKVLNHVPFFDSDKWSKYVNELGLPIMRKKSITINNINDTGLLFRCDDKSHFCTLICVLIGNSFGLTLKLTSNIIGKSIAFYKSNSK